MMDVRLLLWVAVVLLLPGTLACARSAELRLIEVRSLSSLGSPDDPARLDQFTELAPLEDRSSELPSARSAFPQQSATYVADEMSCGECEVVLERIATLGNSGPALHMMSVPAMDGKGRLFIGNTYEGPHVAVYEQDGTFVKTFGRSGGGPGEFRQIRLLHIDAQDSIHVFEPARHTVVAPGGDTLGSIHPLFLVPGAAVEMADGTFLVQAALYDGAGEVDPLHLVSRDGSVRASFGSTDGLDMRFRQQGSRKVALSERGIWVGHVAQYRLELWGRDGQLKRVIVRDPPWFDPWTDEQVQGLHDRPTTAGVAEDEDGLLWSLIMVARSDRPMVNSQSGEEVRVGEVDLQEHFQTIIEVIDPGKNVVVARTRSDQAILGLIGQRRSGLYAYSKRIGAQGLTLVDIWRLRLNRPR